MSIEESVIRVIKFLTFLSQTLIPNGNLKIKKCTLNKVKSLFRVSFSSHTEQ